MKTPLPNGPETSNVVAGTTTTKSRSPPPFGWTLMMKALPKSLLLSDAVSGHLTEIRGHQRTSTTNGPPHSTCPTEPGQHRPSQMSTETAIWTYSSEIHSCQIEDPTLPHLVMVVAFPSIQHKPTQALWLQSLHNFLTSELEKQTTTSMPPSS